MMNTDRYAFVPRFNEIEEAALAINLANAEVRGEMVIRYSSLLWLALSYVPVEHHEAILDRFADLPKALRDR